MSNGFDVIILGTKYTNRITIEEKEISGIYMHIKNYNQQIFIQETGIAAYSHCPTCEKRIYNYKFWC